MSFTTLTHKVRRHVEDHNWQVAVGKVCKGVCAPLYTRADYRIYRIDVSRWSDASVAPPEGFAFRMLTTSDHDGIAAVEQYAEWLSGQLHDMIAAGGLCLLATCNGEPAGFNLATFGGVYMPLVKVHRTFASNAAWSEHIMVYRHFRGRGLAKQIRRRMFAELARRGTRYFYGGAETWNTTSLGLAQSLGFREIADISFRRILGVKFHFIRRVPASDPR
ncbi:MAG: GNAT family N-acetyltransferase [Pirellulales bacterium]|nr:GNAT family N-acetyltransferase [Planctomycetales bacterium]